MISILDCSWLPLPPCLPSLSPFMISILPSFPLFMISILGCCWLPLPPSLSPFMISILGCCHLVSPACLPSWSPCWAALGGSRRLVSQVCLRTSWSPFWAGGSRSRVVSQAHDLHSGLLLAAAAELSPKLASLRDFPSGLLLAAASQACSPSWFPLLAAASQACLPSWLAAAAALSGCWPRNRQMVVMPLPPCLPSLSPCMISILPSLPFLMISILGCSWRQPLPSVSQACLPSRSPFWAALGGSCCRCSLVSQACLPSRSWLPLPPPKLVPLRDLHSGLPLPPCLPSLSPFMIALPEESMVSEHVWIRNKKRLLHEYSKKALFASLQMLSGVYAGVIHVM